MKNAAPIGAHVLRPRLSVGAEERARFELVGLGLDPGRALLIARLLDGSRTLDGLLGTLLAEGFALDASLAILRWTDGSRLVEDNPSSCLAKLDLGERERLAPQVGTLAAWAGEQQSAWSLWSERGVEAQLALKNASVVILGDDDWGARLFDLLRAAGLSGCRLDEPGGALDRAYAPGEFVIHCPAEFDTEACLALNRISVEAGARLLAVRRDQYVVDVGPLVVPRQKACYECFVLRFRGAGNPIPEGEAPAQLAFPFGPEWVALEIIRAVTLVAEPVTLGHLWRLGLLDGTAVPHAVLKLPRCPACGISDKRPRRKLWEE